MNDALPLFPPTSPELEKKPGRPVPDAAGRFDALRAVVQVLSTRIGSIEAQMLKIADVLIHIGRQDERLNSHEKRIDKLEDRHDG